MRLFELILQNVSPQQIAKDLAMTFSNSNAGNVISVTTKHFLHSVMDAIGFNYYVTSEEISTSDFQWPNQEAMFYRFRYEETIFHRYCVFLAETCKIMKKKNLLEELTKIIDAYLSFCDSVEEPWGENFREPFSLICFSILKAMLMITNNLTTRSVVMDNICHKLFLNCEKGLGFSDSHQTIFKGLCIVLEKDYDRFSSIDNNVFKFYTRCMEYEFAGNGCDLFLYMRNAVENTTVNSSAKIAFFNSITDSNMIKAYCAFAQLNSKKLLTSLLKFLNSLLDHLPVLECITKEQLHIIFGNVFNKSKKVRHEAVKFYMAFMRKSAHHNTIIFRDILDFCILRSVPVDDLDDFIDLLWDEFSYMTNLDPYFKILANRSRDMKVQSITAQFVYRVYERLYKNYDNNDVYALRLSKFLLNLPNLLTRLNEKWQIRGILLGVYSITNPETSIVMIKDFPIAANRFIKYALRCLSSDGENPSVVQNTVFLMLEYMDHFNMQDEMEQFANDVVAKYKRLMTHPMELTESQVMSLQNVLILLASLCDTSSALNEEKIFDLVSDVEKWLIESNTFQELSATYDCYLDSYAITIYSGCLNILSIVCFQITPDGTNSESEVLLEQVTTFLRYLLQRFENSDFYNVTIVLAEAVIRALCDLYIVFNFKLERHVYHTLVNCVSFFVFDEPKSTSHSRRQLELQRNILHSFNILHKVVEIPVPITWKIVIHFGLKPLFEKELTELMDILFEYNSERLKKPALFTYVVPVAIYNLFQRKVTKKFHEALKAHKSYVEAKVSDETQRIMKLHIVLTMVDMIERAIQAGDIHQQTNRMQLLTKMKTFLTDVYRSDLNLVVNESRRLESHSLTRDELSTLTSFQAQLS